MQLTPGPGSAEHQSNRKYDLDHLYNQFLSNVIHSGLQDVVIPVRAKSADAAGAFRNASTELIYIDGDHSMPGVLSDLRHYLPKVSKGGILCGDDWGWTAKNYPKTDEIHDYPVQRAMKTFLAENPGFKVNVEGGWFWWIQL